MYEKRGLYDYFCNRRKRDQSVETNLAAGGRSERPVQFTGGGKRRESRANYSMAVFGYSMRSIKETESERETREERGKEEEIDRESPEQKIPAGSADRLDWD